MFRFQHYNRKTFSIRILLCVAVLAIIGILILNSAMANDLDRDSTMFKQALGLGIGTALMLFLSIVDYHFILKFAPLIMALNLILLLLVLTPAGVSSHGATRWLNLGVQIQPSEFTKIFMIIFLAWFFGKHELEINHPLVVFGGIFFFAASAGLILAEPDLSTTLVIAFIFVVMIFASKLSWRWILAFILLAIPLVLIGIFIVSKYSDYLINELNIYQVKRVLSWLHPEQFAANGSNTQQDNSVLAIASGQLFGKGLNNTSFESVKNGNFLSEANNDFIFAVVGEELGFVGCIIIIGIMAILVFECLKIASWAKDSGGRLICIGVASLFAFQSFVNIGVAIKLLPNTGLPFPFFSAGLSSLLSLFIGLGMILNVSMQRKSTVSDW